LNQKICAVTEAWLPKKKAVHFIIDNYAAHKQPQVLKWLAKHPRFVFHFTPTSASWLNAVEGFFANLAKKRLKRGVFQSVQELKDATTASSTKPTQIQSPSLGIGVWIWRR
jgi:transposase